MREQYHRVASGVRVPTDIGHAGPRAAGRQSGFEVLDEVLDVAAAAVLGAELDTLHAILARVPDRIALEMDVRLTEKPRAADRATRARRVLRSEAASCRSCT